jgi:hypothetical protein
MNSDYFLHRINWMDVTVWTQCVFVDGLHAECSASAGLVGRGGYVLANLPNYVDLITNCMF